MDPMNTDQLPLFEINEPGPSGESLAERFEAFHAANPHILGALIKLARRCKAAGWNRASMNQFFERLRWDYAWQTKGDSYKLNNSYRAYYARLVMAVADDLDGFFEIRAQKDEYEPNLREMNLETE